MPVIVAAAVFITIVLLIYGAYLLYDQTVYGDPTVAARRMRVDLDVSQRAAAIEIVRRDALGNKPWYAAIADNITPLVSLQRLLRQADSDMPVSVFLGLSAILTLVCLVVALVAGLGVGGTMLAMLPGAFGPLWYFRRRKQRRLKAIEAQLPDALDLIARTLMAGHAFIMGLKMVAEQMEDPLGGEFRKTFDEISFGISVQDAIRDMSERMDSVDVKFLVTSLLVQLETGGNLAEIVQGISRLIRKRFELYGKIRALSAEGRISALVMFSLPFFVGGALFFMNPSYMMLLFTDSAGPPLLIGGLVMMVLGALVTRRMIQIEV